MVRSRFAPPVLLLSVVSAAGCAGEAREGTAQASEAPPSTSASPPPAASPQTAQDSAAVVAAMHQLYEGLTTSDTNAVTAVVSTAGMVYMDHHGVVPLTVPEGTAYMVGLCRIRSYAMDSVRTSSPTAGVMLLAFKLTIDETCGERRTPSPVYALSTWHQQGGAWKLAAFAGAPAADAR